ncbi:hypothetical protein KCU81_g1702, partial [Aureobasidium melanogenum]
MVDMILFTVRLGQPMAEHIQEVKDIIKKYSDKQPKEPFVDLLQDHLIDRIPPAHKGQDWGLVYKIVRWILRKERLAREQSEKS